MKLLLVRHAKPLAPPGTCYGASDIPADARHTAYVARALAGRLPAAALVFCSPLQRCAALAAAVAALRPDVRTQVDGRLREMDFGHWEGRPWRAIARAEIEAWTGDFAHHRPGGGESVASMLARVAPALEEARGWAIETGSAPVWITHAGVMRAAMLLAKGAASPPEPDRWPRRVLRFGQCMELVLGRHARSPSD
ncbi:MAG: histidine phosphatase family protein [Ramlibacter sp.]